MRLETELLLACIRPACSPALIEGLVDGKTLDWSRFVDLATNHHVIPLVYRALKHEATLPATVREQLRRDRMRIAAHSVRAAYVLQRLQRRAAEQNIDLIPVKGPALAILAHGQGRESMRQFEDLDLVVKPNDFLRAIDWLEALGYQPDPFLSSPNMRKRYFKTGQDWGLRKDGDPLILELNPTLIWHVLSDGSSVDWLRANSQPLKIDESKSLRAPTPEAMLLAVCLDGTHDKWRSLSTIADVAHLLNAHPDANWGGLLGNASIQGHQRALLVGLHITSELLDCPLPPPFQDALEKDHQALRLATPIVKRLRADPSRYPTVTELCLFAFRTRQCFRDRARFALRLLFTPCLTELRAFRLPARLFPLYALLRPFRLARDVRRGK